MLDNNTLVVFFSTVAAIVATLTGLIGAFATFKLQKIETKLDFLKDYTLHKELDEEKTLNNKIRIHHYLSIRHIYVHNLKSIEILRQCIEELDYHNHSAEYMLDLENITNFQNHYDEIKNLTKEKFITSLSFVFINLVALVSSNFIINSMYCQVFIGINLLGIIYIFSLFTKQIKLLIS